MSGQNDIWAEAYRRNILPPEKKALYEEAMRRGLVQGPERSLGRRFLDNLSDTWNTNWIASGFRRGYDLGAHGDQMRRVERGAAGIGDIVNATEDVGQLAGNVRRFLSGGASAEALSTAALQAERDRRALYQARSSADPFYRAGDNLVDRGLAGAATLGGVIAGSALDPASYVSPGRTIAARAVAQGAIAGGADLAAQQQDVGSGLQDEYDVARGAFSALAGAGFSVATDAVRPVSRWVRSAFTDRIEPLTAGASNVGERVHEIERPPPSPEPFTRGQVRSVADMPQYIAERRNADLPNPNVDVRFDAGDMHPHAKALLDDLAPGFGDTPARVRINGRALSHVDARRPDRLDRLTSEIEDIVQRPDEIWPNVSAANAGRDPWARPWLVRSKGSDGTAVVVEVAPGADGIDVVTIISPLGKKQRARAEKLLATEGRHAAETAVPSYPPSAAEAGRSPDAFPIVGASGETITPEFGIVQSVNRKSPLKDAISRVREGELPQMVGDFLARAYTDIVDDQHPLARAVEDIRSQTEAITGAPLDILPSEDPRKLARGRFDWAAIGHQDLLHGVHAFKGIEPTTPALADVISAVAVRAKRADVKPEDAIQRFNEYMVARRSLVEWDRFGRGEIEKPPVARTREQADAFVKKVEADSPELRELSDGVNDYAGGLLKKALDGGLIDKATYDASLANRDFYVPMRRVMAEGAAKSGKPSAGNKASDVKAFRGSERDVVDPISVLIQRTYRLNQRIHQNELNLSLVRMGERLEAAQRAAGIEGENGWLRKVDTPMRKTTVGADELKAASRQPELVDDMFDADGMEVWRPGEINDQDQAIIYTWRDGKREAWEIVDQDWGKDVFEAISGMSKGMEDTFLNTVAAPTAILAQTITRDPAFLFSNFIRDQLSTWVLTDVGFKPGEGLAGIADELSQADVTRLYGLSGGISGGAATAMMGDALHKADTLALAQKGIKAKYFSSLGGLLATSEISETGTRLRVFKRAFDRAKKEGFGEYDALIQAGFTARDVLDFGRAGSKMHMTRRLVTFLNAYVQGLAKTLRTLGADGAMTRVPLKDALRPLVGMQVPPGQMRAEDRAALQLAGRAWTKVAAIATFGAAITALYHDDPDWQQANEKTRATHWTIPFGDYMARIPKPFELAFLSNIVERGIEATAGRDEKAWERMWKGLGMLFAPPTDIPVVGVLGGLQSNTNSQTDRPIVPDYLQEMPPELQYQHWNSGFSRWLGEQIKASPAKIDYAIQGFSGPFGSYLLNGMDASDPDRPAGSWTDLPVVRRFVSPSYRGSQDKRDFYDRAGAKTAELRRALNGIREYQEQGRNDAARAIFEDLDEQGRLFVSSQMGETPTRRLNPLERARVVGQEASRIIGELNGALPKDDGVPLPPMDRRRKQAVEEAIERIAVAEMRNSMIVTRQPGFQNRALMDRDGLWEDLRDMAPEVASELERRLGSGRDRAYDYKAVVELWPQVEQRLRTEGTAAYLDDLAGEAEARTPSWGDKALDDGAIPEALVYKP